jgi:hypothetical protein
MVEVARDVEFTKIVNNISVAQTEAESSSLDEGDYFWRVTAVDRNGLVGLPGSVGRLSIRPNLDVMLHYDGLLLNLGHGFVAGPENVYTAKPARELTSVSRIEYSLDASPYRPLGGPLRMKEEGLHVLRMRGVSPSGQAGEPDALTVRVDASGPKLRISRRSPQQNSDGTESFEVFLEAVDPTGVDWIKYRIDGNPFQIFTGPISLSPYHDYVLECKARDVVGNESPVMVVTIEGERVPRRK